MSEIEILKTSNVKITMNKINNLLTLKVKDDEYNENGFTECLEYIKSSWEYIKKENLKYSFLIDMGTSAKEHELPLHAYVKIVNMISNLNETLVEHCHCVVILTEGSLKWQKMYDFITKLWTPEKQRPLKFTDSVDEATAFMLNNKLL